jgi:predicted RNase H-like nuclease
MRVVGVDGCRGSWLVATVADGDVEWQLTGDIATVLAARVDAIGIDIPIGLPESGPRACDVAARLRVGARRSSVFPAPPRCVLQSSTYADARAVLRQRGVASMSAQAFGIVRAIRSVDDAMTRRLEGRVVETHPEVSFAAMRGRDLAAKKTAAGVGQRIEALRGWLDVIPALATTPVGVPIDDALDALACAWSAERFARGVGEVLGDGQRDARGLLMRIVV